MTVVRPDAMLKSVVSDVQERQHGTIVRGYLQQDLESVHVIYYAPADQL
jgi:hypothetical protein